METQLSYKYM